MKTVFIFLAGWVMGLIIGMIFPVEPSMRRHWDVVEKYVSYMSDPASYTRDVDSGLMATDPPSDPRSSLAALVAAGELRHVDLVFPQVPYVENLEPLRYWQEFVLEHDDVVFASGNLSSIGFEPQGEQPLCLKLWFRSSARNKVQQLVRDLDERWGEGRKVKSQP